MHLEDVSHFYLEHPSYYLSLRHVRELDQLVDLPLRQLLVPVLVLEGRLQVQAVLLVGVPVVVVGLAAALPESEPDANGLVEVALQEVAEHDEEGGGRDGVQQVVEVGQTMV